MEGAIENISFNTGKGNIDKTEGGVSTCPQDGN
jgi:hypothetical protein